MNQLAAWIVMGGLLAAIVGLDIWLLADREQLTVSQTLRRAAQRWKPLAYILCFGVGVLMGHLFW